MARTRLSRQRAMEEPTGLDPLAVLGADIFRCVLSLLTPSQLLEAGLVCKGWHALSGEEKVWEGHCREAWQERVYAPARGRPDLPWKQRWLGGEADLERSRISAEELCAFSWRFRFKRTAGAFWVQLDPWWNGEGPPLRRHFWLDGRLTAPEGDAFMDEGHEMKWRFTKTQDGVKGHYVKVNQYPSLSISRTKRGGWQMENCWVVFNAELRPGGPYEGGVASGTKLHQS